MSARDFCPPFSPMGEWWHPSVEDRVPSEERVPTSVQWSADKHRKRIVEFLLQSVIALEESNPAVGERERTLEQRFLEQANIWDRETAHLSSTPKMVLHDSYQKIMAMGPDVVPFLLRDLQDNRRSWFWALRHLTNANPVPPGDQGNLDKMIAAWVAWGKREGRI